MKDNKRAGRYLLAAAGAALILYFILSLLFHWGVNIVFLLLGGWLVYCGMPKLRERRRVDARFERLEKYKKAAAAVVILGVLSFAAIEALILSGALKEDHVKADYVIILGASLRNGKMSKNTVSRLEKAMEYIKGDPEVKIIVTGGTPPGEAISEAAVMEGFLLEQGISGDRIIKEDRSTSTYKNFKYSKRILEQTDRAEPISLMIITNEFHQYRARLIARHLGFTAYGQPAATPLHLAPNCYMREYFAVVKTWLFDLLLGWEVG